MFDVRAVFCLLSSVFCLLFVLFVPFVVNPALSSCLPLPASLKCWLVLALRRRLFSTVSTDPAPFGAATKELNKWQTRFVSV